MSRDLSDPCDLDLPSGWRKIVAEHGSRAEQVFDRFRQRLKDRLGLGDPVHVQLYRGFGTTKSVRVSGRVLEDEGAMPPSPEDTRWTNLVRAYRLFETDERPGARVNVHFAGRSHTAVADEEGFFDVTVDAGDHPFSPGVAEVTADLLEPAGHQTEPKRSTITIPGPHAQYAIVSDVDDTIMHSEATNFIRLVMNTVLNNAYGRVAFPGVGAFYQALTHGTRPVAGGEGVNPIFYLTSSMWNVYDVIRLFIDVNGIPPGPLLMRDLGLSKTQLIKGTHAAHKLCRVRELMATYPDLRFVLVGDTGQHDAEIYRDVALELAKTGEAERLAAVYLRDVTGRSREAEVSGIVGEISGVGVPTLAGPDTAAMAQHAEANGLIAPRAVEDVADRRATDEAIDAVSPL